MSEQQSNSLVEGQAREQFERELLKAYRIRCAHHALDSIKSIGTLPQFKGIFVGIGNGPADPKYLKNRYTFAPEHSVIGIWSHEYYSRNGVQYQHESWQDFITKEISQHLELTSPGGNVDREELAALLDRVIKGDPLYEFWKDPEVKYIKINQGHLEGELPRQVEKLVERLAGEVAGCNFVQFLSLDLDPEIRLGRFMRLVLDEKCPENFGERGKQLLKQLIQLLVDEIDMDCLRGGPAPENWNELNPYEKYPKLAECANMKQVENLRKKIDKLMFSASLADLDSEVQEQIELIDWSKSEEVWEAISKNIVDYFVDARILNPEDRDRYNQLINRNYAIHRDQTDLASLPVATAQTYQITLQIYKDWKVKQK
ncbi:MAG: hypothetical protein H7230_02565 [Candidatus Parcubacteria bacterium]|nr:hypothetical protein [Candidatus Paceibacterota bacterium]